LQDENNNRPLLPAKATEMIFKNTVISTRSRTTVCHFSVFQILDTHDGVGPCGSQKPVQCLVVTGRKIIYRHTKRKRYSRQ